MSKTNLIVEPGRQDFTVTRVFDAPPELLFKAYTDPNLLRQWLGPRRLTMTVCEMEPESGGSWHFVHRDADGHDYGFHGVFHTVAAPQRIVRTFEFEGVPGHVSLETATFEGQEGKTKLTIHSVFQSVEDRDVMVAAGMETGINEGMDQLDELLRDLQKGQVPVR